MATKTKVSVDEGIDFAQYLDFSGVQSVADAFLQISVPTGVSPVNGFILNVLEIVFSIDVLQPPTGANPSLDVTVTRATKAAIPTFSDPDLIAKSRIAAVAGGALTAVGLLEMPFNVAFTGKQIVAAEDIFVQFDTAGFGAAHSVSGRIYYETVAMSKERILEILYG